MLAALAELGSQASPGRLVETTGLASATVTKHLRRLRSEGLVTGGQRSPRLTATGRREVARDHSHPAVSVVSVSPHTACLVNASIVDTTTIWSPATFDRALAILPTGEHRAFLRVLIDNVIAG